MEHGKHILSSPGTRDKEENGHQHLSKLLCSQRRSNMHASHLMELDMSLMLVNSCVLSHQFSETCFETGATELVAENTPT